MFSKAEKQYIAKAFEKILLELNHPEMPKERPDFFLRIIGKEPFSWAEIEPNWRFEEEEPGTNPWNEKAREILKEK